MTESTGWYPGLTSEQYETSGNGPGTISTGKDDHGGVSYGSYQLSSEEGTLKEYLDQSAYKAQFKGLELVTPEFNDKWRELARTDPGFAQDQYNFIKTTHYDVQVSRLKVDGLDLTDRGSAVQDALWSTSVQFRGKTIDVFEKGLQEKFGKSYKLSDLSDKDIIEAAQDYKIVHNEELFKSSPNLWANLVNRANAEKEDLLNLADGKVVDNEARHAHGHILRQGAHSDAVSALQNDLAALGYTDAKGQSLQPDGHFGSATKAVVEAFQRDSNLTPDGVVGPATLATLHVQRQALAELPSFASELRGAPSTRGSGPGSSVSVPINVQLRDFRHLDDPDHGLYTALQRRIPDASEERLVQFTAACHTNRITADNLGKIHLDEQAMILTLAASQPLGPLAQVDLRQPPPSPQQSMRHMQAFDQQHALQAQFNDPLVQTQTGPMPGGSFNSEVHHSAR